jgi:hypothetical protein
MGTVGNFAFESFRNSKNALVITNNTSIAFITKEKIVMEVVKRKEQKWMERRSSLKQTCT